jgi:hypothetical protein
MQEYLFLCGLLKHRLSATVDEVNENIFMWAEVEVTGVQAKLT